MAPTIPAPTPSAGYVYGRAPLLVYWEVTRACDLACRHCRADAMAAPLPGELTTPDGLALLGSIAAFGRPLPQLVLTGGDPLTRRDLFELVGEARRLGIGVSLAPAATPLLTGAMLERIANAGIGTISLSLDGSDASRHDDLRGVPGCFDRTMEAAARARELGLGVQVNTLVTADTVDDLPAVYRLVRGLGIVRWSLFFLVPVGRGTILPEVSPARAERLLDWLFERSAEAPFAIKTTEALHYRRVAVRRLRAAGLDEAAIARTSIGRGFGIRDGNGIVFVSHDGDVSPSGFLPLPVGNVRRRSLVALYRDAPLLRALRDVRRLKGRCGRCPFAPLCGGSRARAFAATGDPLEADPLCPYVPAAPSRRSPRPVAPA